MGYSLWAVMLDTCWTNAWACAGQCLDLCWASVGQVLGLNLEICCELCWNYAWGDHNETWWFSSAIHVEMSTLTLIAMATTSS